MPERQKPHGSLKRGLKHCLAFLRCLALSDDAVGAARSSHSFCMLLL